MKKLILFILVVNLFANSYVIDLIGKKKFIKYKPLLSNLEKNLSLKETIKKLEDLGLINLFFEKPKVINTEFIFVNNNPILELKILYKSLNLMGYYYFYPSKSVLRENKYLVDIEMKTNHYLNPLIFINTIEDFGCKVKEIVKKDKYYFFLDCKKAMLPAISLSEKKTKYINVVGEYWIKANSFKKMEIITSKYDNWYPYIVFYDKNLNILNIIAYKKMVRDIIVNIPEETFYIKIKDNYSKINFKRGILIKGLK
jgi:hypothetical protein